MKTDRFDDEFRRKLQNLPADADKTDVERTYAYVRTNHPVVYGVSWSKLLLFGVGGLLLLGMLLYNGIQYRRTKQLQALVDSLSRQSISQLGRAVQHDTIYITRSEKAGAYSSPTLPDGNPEQARESGAKQSEPFSSASQMVDEAASDETRMVLRVDQRDSRVSAGTSQPEPSRPGDASVNASQPVERTAQSAEPADAVGSEPSNPSLLNRSQRSVVQTSQPAISPATTSLSESGTDIAAPFAGTESANRRSTITARSTSQRKNRQKNLSSRRGGTLSSVNSSGGDVIAEAIRPVIIAEPLTTRALTPASGLSDNRLIRRSLTVPKMEVIASAKSTKRSWHLTMPRLSVLNAQYRIGTGLLGGPYQLSGSLLGELQINRHWSMQTGVQVSLVDEFHYRDEQDFGKHRNRDFRQTYGVQAPSSADIEDIDLRSTLFQLPIQVAYHYQLGRQWGLRLGLGTELTLGLSSTIGYNYRDNNRSNEYRLTVSSESTSVFNNLTLSTSLERSWKRWQFRAGPFISPQLRLVSYKSDDLLWGGSLQIFYQLGK